VTTKTKKVTTILVKIGWQTKFEIKCKTIYTRSDRAPSRKYHFCSLIRKSHLLLRISSSLLL